MRKLAYLLVLPLLISCSSRVYKFRKGDTVQVRGLISHNTFEIIDTAGNMNYEALDLKTGRHIERLAQKGMKLYKPKVNQPKP